MVQPRSLPLILAWAIIASGMLLGSGLPVRAQSASMLESIGSSRTITNANSSGFGFSSNGTFAYDGPINALGVLQSQTSLKLEYDNRTILVHYDDALIRQRMDPARYPSSSLSGELSRGQVVQAAPGQPVELGYSQSIPAITRLGASNSITRFEQVDGQSLSVFPSFSPTVFP